MSELLDADDRVRAIRERERNVIVDASAGTGKTRLVVERIVELVAPSGAQEPISIARIAAITFTRKAAGELRVRTRQEILRALSSLPSGSPRAAPLLAALGGIDTVHIGTIHGFADRLLRRFPAEAKLDPLYALDDDDTTLTDECFDLLVQTAETGTLGDLLRGSAAESRTEEAATTILDAQRAGLRLRSRETEHWTYCGLDRLVAAFVLRRDVECADPDAEPFDHTTFRRYADEYLRWVDGLATETSGSRWLVSIGEILRRVASADDPAVIFRELVERMERGPRGRASDEPGKKRDFGGDDRAWDMWKAIDGDSRREPVRASSLREDLLGPLRRWLAIRLVRLRPVVHQVYEVVKARHRVVDHVDLLLRLRDLLRDHLDVRHACQTLFDHIFVDEFQDTDPLQAEIVMFLCERGAEAARWEEVTVAPGTLTVVGDPKQSIYRFRRADIATYERVIEIVSRSAHIAVTLTSSFRSAPGLVSWLNERFSTILGTAGQGTRFRAETGDVYYQPLSLGRSTGSDPTVHAVAMDLDQPASADDVRVLEAGTMARYMRWLVERSGAMVHDPLTSTARAVGYGDIGVLAMTTTNLPLLFDALDREGVPYAVRGGSLFLSDPLHRRFLLGLCALADRDDGVALAALLRPPFFAVDLGDLARTRRDAPDDRAEMARAIVRELRRRRFERSPGETARALLEETGFAATVALGPNGSQRLAGLRELCFQIEKRAVMGELDFDATIESVRGWIDRPQGLDRPHPVGGESVRAMTVHQAKGLEFPVVVLWDARAAWAERARYEPWLVDRDGRGWALRLDTLRYEQPPQLEIDRRERLFREAERKRLAYVAATRARDLLVIPRFGHHDARCILSSLLGLRASPTVLEQPLHRPEAHAAWFDDVAGRPTAPPAEQTELDRQLMELWRPRAEAASAPHLRPVAFTEASAPRALWGKKGRFGTLFGETVHVAIGLALGTNVSPSDAVRTAAARSGLTTHRAEAVADVTRALGVLGVLGIVDASRWAVEYPVTGVTGSGSLVSGYVDLIARFGEDVVLLDFKTDAPPGEGEPMSQRYIDQVTGYATVLERALELPIRAGLLYTANGVVHWLSSGDNARA